MYLLQPNYPVPQPFETIFQLRHRFLYSGFSVYVFLNSSICCSSSTTSYVMMDYSLFHKNKYLAAGGKTFFVS